MNQERAAATGKALHECAVRLGLCTRWAPSDTHLLEAQAALAAADAVMFSDEAVERAAQSLHGETGLYWHAMTEQERQRRRDTARAVIAALKGDDA